MTVEETLIDSDASPEQSMSGTSGEEVTKQETVATTPMYLQSLENSWQQVRRLSFIHFYLVD